jgi:hypothetical protein
MDDKIDGFFYYTRFIKFGVGRAMIDSAQEIRNGHISKEEGASLIEKFDGEYPKKYEDTSKEEKLINKYIHLGTYNDIKDIKEFQNKSISFMDYFSNKQ